MISLETWFKEAAPDIERLKAVVERDTSNVDSWIQLMTAAERRGQLLAFADYLLKNQPHSTAFQKVFEAVEKRPKKSTEQLAFLWKVSMGTWDWGVAGYPDLTREEFYRSPDEYLPPVHIEWTVTEPGASISNARVEKAIPLKTFATQTASRGEIPPFVREIDRESEWMTDPATPFEWFGSKFVPIAEGDTEGDEEDSFVETLVKVDFAVNNNGNPQGQALMERWTGKSPTKRRKAR